MDALIPFSSQLLQDMVSTSEMRAIWSERNTVQKWMDIEAAITRAQIDLGLIPRNAGQEILDLTTYTGTAGLQTDQTVTALRSTRSQLV